jgi:hypothetical protein
VSTIRLRKAVWLGSLVIALGCRSALEEPPPVNEIGGAADRPIGRADELEAVLARADLEFAKRPDEASVERAQALYLEAARIDGAPPEAFLGAATATAWLIEHEPDEARRAEMAVEGVQIGQHCVRLYPAVTECTYRLALAVGQQAREIPSTAIDGLGIMVELLQEVTADAPDTDQAGGDRVLALVLLRAPGWPTGPGDPETALIHAQGAVERFPQYPPNQLTLGEALLANGRPEEARLAYQRGAEYARVKRDAGVPEAVEWLGDAKKGLTDLK